MGRSAQKGQLDEWGAEDGDSSFSAVLECPIATTRIVRFSVPAPPDTVMRFDGYHLNLSLTPRPTNMRARFCDRWDRHRFEKVGDLFLIPPGEIVHMKGDSPAVHASIICDINADMLHDWLGFSIDWSDRRLLAVLNISGNSIRRHMRRLAEESRNPGVGTAKQIEMLSGLLALEVGRFCDAVVDTPVIGGLASWRLRLIDERLAVKQVSPPLPELAALCSISVRQLTRGFRVSRGCTLGDYIMQNRIETAKRLLQEDCSVKSIAHDLGFASPSSFAHAFRRMSGLTPRQFLHRVYRAREAED